MSVFEEDGFQIGKCERAISFGLEVSFQKSGVNVGFGHWAMISQTGLLGIYTKQAGRERESSFWNARYIYLAFLYQGNWQDGTFGKSIEIILDVTFVPCQGTLFTYDMTRAKLVRVKRHDKASSFAS